MNAHNATTAPDTAADAAYDLGPGHRRDLGMALHRVAEGERSDYSADRPSCGVITLTLPNGEAIVGESGIEDDGDRVVIHVEASAHPAWMPSARARVLLRKALLGLAGRFATFDARPEYMAAVKRGVETGTMEWYD
jgi:hypothetical protein